MEQLTKLITGLSLTQKISIVLVAIAAGIGIYSFSHWRHEGDFRPLYTNMAAEDAATVVQKLKESGVEYRLAENGATVLVASQKLAESRLTLAQAGLPRTGRIGFELFDKSNFGATEFVEHINYKRALEGELERSVMSLAEVEEARVHLTLPKESVFLDQQEPAKASVMVKLKAGERISLQNVQAVTNLVASAVEGLTPEAVSVVGMDGTLLSRPRKKNPDGAEMTSETLEVRQQLERTLVAKISQTLEPLLGADKFRAGASVDYDLTSGEQQEETLDPNKSVMLSSQKSEDLVQKAQTSGIPGTASNLPPSGAANKNPTETSRRTENITYQTSRLIKHTKIPQGQIKRMSLAVLVDQAVQWEGDGANRKRVLVPPSTETLKTIKDLVAGVTGYDEERGDQLIVETLPFESSLTSPPPALPNAPGAHGPAPAVKDPPWLVFVNAHRNLWLPVGAGAGVLFLLMIVFVVMRLKSRKRKKLAEMQAAIEAAAAAEHKEHREVGAGAGADAEHRLEAGESASGLPLPEEELVLVGPAGALVEKVRVLVKRDAQVTANILRAWIADSKTNF